jgi:hypothetical protein
MTVLLNALSARGGSAELPAAEPADLATTALDFFFLAIGRI